MDEHERQGWTVVAGGVLIFLMLGLTYTWSIFKDPLVEMFNWSQTEVQLAFSIMLAVFALTMIPAGMLQDKRGPKIVALAGGLLLCLGMVATSLFANSPLMLYITYGVLVGAGVGLAYNTPIACSAKWFPQRRGLVTGIVAFGFGFGSLIIAPVAQWLISRYGIMQSFMYLGVGLGAIIVLGALLLKNPPESHPAAKKAAVASEYGPIGMLKTPQCWMLWVMFAFSAAAGLMVIGNLASFAKLSFTAGGMSADAAKGLATLAVGVLAVFNGGGRILAGWVSDRIGREKTMFVMFGAQALLVASVVFVSGFSPWALIGVMALIGLCFGSNFSLFPSSTADYFGTKSVGVNYGFIFTSYGFGGIVGPMVMAYMLDAAKAATGTLAVGSYTLPFLLVGGLVGIAAVISLFTKCPGMKEEPAATAAAKPKAKKKK